jgi:type IVB pilus formation R64 PilN family outer membrane protein
MRSVSQRTVAAITLPVVLPFALAACGSMQRDIERQTDTSAQQITDYRARVTTMNVTSNVAVVQRVSGAWLGGHAVPMQADSALPEIFRREGWRFIFPDKGTMLTVAERLQKNTGIPVRVQPDVLMPMSAFLNINGTSIASEDKPAAQGAAMTPGSVTTLPPLPSPAAGGALAAGTSSIVASPASQAMYEMHYIGTLAGYLELLCAQAGISWDYHDGVITLRRLVTKTFVLKSLPGSSGLQAGMGRDGQTQTGTQTSGGSSQSVSTGGYSTTGKVEMSSTFSVWASLDKSIQAVKTPVGRYAISEATGTITVTDTRAAVEEIGRIIDHENSTLTRQVAMRVEVISVKLSGNNQYGVDWTAVFQKVTHMVPWALSYTSPATLVSTTTAGSLGASVLAPTDGSTGTWTGSQAFVTALSDYGRAKVLTTANAMTINRQPVPVAITQQTGYLAEVTPAPAGASGSAGGTPGLMPGTVTTGFMLNLLPTVLDSNNIQLQVSVGISSLDALVKQTSGSGTNQNSIQTPTVSSTDFLQKVSMRPGQTLVLSGYERDSRQFDKRTLTPGAPIGFGGSFNGTDEREAVVILVTPVVTEGAI